MSARVGEVAIFTADVEATRRFYESLLGVPPEAEWPGGVVFDAGGVKLLVHHEMPRSDDEPPNEDHVAFSVADVDGACAGLRGMGVELLVEPRDFSWGRSAYLRDPDGRLVELARI
jgi:catechol 2,3-dioxygenase-like lactoylglutathione lyase family enzyme